MSPPMSVQSPGWGNEVASVNKLARVAAPAWVWPRSYLSKSVNAVMAKKGRDALAVLHV